MKRLLNRGIVWVVVLTAHVLAQDAVVTAVGAQDSPTQQEKLPATLTAGKSFDPAGKTSVVNWKLTCQQLCGEGFGGPACGLACLQQNTIDESKRIKLDRKSQNAVCPTLCENGLGSRKCKCKPTSPPSVSHNHVAVCKAFCGTASKVRLSGCSPCEEAGTDLVTDSRSTLAPNTTPNWDELCLVWCKMGEGGTVCNCDLPPFI